MDIIKSKDYKAKEPIVSRMDLSKNGLSRLSSKLIDKADTFFTWSILILALVVLLCLGLWGYQIKLSRENEALVQEIDGLQAQRDLDLEKDFIGLKKRIEVLKVILSNRIYPSKVFGMIEELILAKVQLGGLSVDLAERSMIWGVEAEDYSTLAKQLFVLKNDPRIQRASLTEVSLNNMGRTVSNIKIEMDDDFLRHE